MLEASRTTTINVTMELGQVTQSIEVKAQAPTLETSSPAMANTVEEKLIRELPTVMRRPEQLIWIIPGVTYYGIDPTNTDTAFFSLAGGRELPMFYIDGASATNARSESDILDLNPSIEITQEFRVIANNAKAEYGGSIGGMMLMTTKSGTNDYHGTLWEYNRQKAYNARNFFARSVLPFQENIFGAAVGGPIKKQAFLLRQLRRHPAVKRSTSRQQLRRDSVSDTSHKQPEVRRLL